jgi:hypothetical protein
VQRDWKRYRVGLAFLRVLLLNLGVYRWWTLRQHSFARRGRHAGAMRRAQASQLVWLDSYSHTAKMDAIDELRCLSAIHGMLVE